MYRPAVGAGVADVDLEGTTALVTGSTDGIGREIALALGRLGATVLVHGRDRAKGEAVLDELAATPGRGELHLADFADLETVRDLADGIADRHDALDVLVNNAGGYVHEGRLTNDGIEYTFAVNHLAAFLLTARLRPLVPAGGRIVTTASEVHRRADGSFDGIDTIEGYDGFDAYGRSKLANVLFTYALARRLDDVAVNCFHPGFVPGSGLWRGAPAWVRAPMWLMARLPRPILRTTAETPATAATTGVYLAAAPAAADLDAEYLIDGEPARSSPVSYDADAQRRLRELSVELTGADV